MRALALLFATSTLFAQATSFEADMKALESKSGGRLGVYAQDTSNNQEWSYRSDERFPMCSTFKVLLAAAVLSRVAQGQEKLESQVSYGKDDLVTWSPVTSPHVAKGKLGVETLLEAVVVQSDNTAANLLLTRVGGPEGYTRYVRSLGDSQTRLDRCEPALNSAIPNDPRDTTTPRNMAMNVKAVLRNKALTPSHQRKLEDWMIACQTGRTRLRAGLPSDWIIGDKTGSGEHGTCNDIAILRPPHRKPIFLAVYLTGSTLDSTEQNAVLAEVARRLSHIWNP